MKKILKMLIIAILVFVSNNVFADVKYSCPDDSYVLSGDKCIKVTKAYQRNGVYYCPPEAGSLKGKDCEKIIDAVKTADESQEAESENDENLISCPAGYIVYEETCVKYAVPASVRSGNYYCDSDKVLIGTGCYSEINSTDNSDSSDVKDDTNDKAGYENIANAKIYCDSLDLLLQDIEGAFNIFKIVAPIFVVLMSTFDFIRAIVGKVDGDMKKAFVKLMKRFVFAIILFFLPIIINFFLGLWDPNYSTCILP